MYSDCDFAELNIVIGIRLYQHERNEQGSAFTDSK